MEKMNWKEQLDLNSVAHAPAHEMHINDLPDYNKNVFFFFLILDLELEQNGTGWVFF